VEGEKRGEGRGKGGIRSLEILIISVKEKKEKKKKKGRGGSKALLVQQAYIPLGVVKRKGGLYLFFLFLI